MFENVFEYRDAKGVLHSRASQRKYPSVEDAEKYKHIPPDGGWKYVRTQPVTAKKKKDK